MTCSLSLLPRSLTWWQAHFSDTFPVQHGHLLLLFLFCPGNAVTKPEMRLMCHWDFPKEGISKLFTKQRTAAARLGVRVSGSVDIHLLKLAERSGRFFSSCTALTFCRCHTEYVEQKSSTSLGPSLEFVVWEFGQGLGDRCTRYRRQLMLYLKSYRKEPDNFG